MELSGKVAFVTASANGIGKGYAEALLAKGVKVFISDIDESTGAATLADFEGKFGKENVRFRKLDVSSEEQFEAVFKEALDTFGQIDIMVNNAGVMNEATWHLMINVNVLGLVKGTKLAEQHMRKDLGGKGGRIINISSMAGLGQRCTLPVYCGTKHAVRSFTMSQAGQYDLEEQGIEYGVICPYPTDTNLIRLADENKVLFYDMIKDRLKDTMPVSRVVEGFMELIQLDKMNGAILTVTKEGKSFVKMKVVDLGSEYVSAAEKPYSEGSASQ